MGKSRDWRGKLRARWRRQTRTQRKTLLILGALVAVALAFSLPSAALSGDWLGLFLNMGTEIGGAVVTFILIDRIVGGGEEEARLKTDLIAQLGSRVNEEAIRAAEELDRHGWMADGSLYRANLSDAHLQGALLMAPDLRRAALINAHLQGASIVDADLREALLTEADLREASLQDAYLQGANLVAANLQGANLRDAEFDEHTVLPNGTHWTPGTDMARFTDPNHPNFWPPPPSHPVVYIRLASE